MPRAKKQKVAYAGKERRKSAATSAAEDKAAANGPRPGSKLATVNGLLTREEGCTAREVMAVCAWPSVSMPAMAKALGRVLRREKQGRGTRYWAVS